MILFLHASPQSLAATQASLERLRDRVAVRQALAPGIVDPRAMTFSEDDRAYERIRRALLGHLRGDEARVIISCSVYNGFAARLQRDVGVPVERSDDAGARVVVARGSRIGLAVSYPPSFPVIERFLLELAAEDMRALEIVPLLEDNAFAYADEPERYGRALVDAVGVRRRFDAVFLSQYSMDPYAPQVGEATALPVVSALSATVSRLA